MDTRLGLGYRFGDAADAQIMWEIGPQLFTQPIPQGRKTKRQTTIENPNIASNRRLYSPSSNRRHYGEMSAPKHTRQPSSTEGRGHKKPLSLLDLWNVGKSRTPNRSALMRRRRMRNPDNANINRRVPPQQSLQTKRRKSLKPYYAKPKDSLDTITSTLTQYEKMLIKMGDKAPEVMKLETNPRNETIVQPENKVSGAHYGSKPKPQYLENAMRRTTMMKKVNSQLRNGARMSWNPFLRNRRGPSSTFRRRNMISGEDQQESNRTGRQSFFQRLFGRRPPNKNENKNRRWRNNMRRREENPQLQNFKNMNSNNDLMADSSQVEQNRRSFDTRGRHTFKKHTVAPSIRQEPRFNPAADDSFFKRNKIPSAKELGSQETRGVPLAKESGISGNKKHRKNHTLNAEKDSLEQKSYDTYEYEIPTSTTKRPNSVVTAVNAIKNLFSAEEEGGKRKKIYSYTKLKLPDLSGIKSLVSSVTKSGSKEKYHSYEATPTWKPPRTTSKPKPLKTKLTLIDGKPQITKVTPEPEYDDGDMYSDESGSSPVVHVGEDMTFDELETVFGNEKEKPVVIDLSGKTENSPKVKDLLVKGKVKEKKPDSDEDNPIFVDIESGEVSVLKPVAQLDAFEPEKEKVLTEFDDEDGDGIPDIHMRREEDIFAKLQDDLVKSYEKMQQAKLKLQSKKRRKEVLAAKGMDETVDMVSKYFDLKEPLDEEYVEPLQYNDYDQLNEPSMMEEYFITSTEKPKPKRPWSFFG